MENLKKHVVQKYFFAFFAFYSKSSFMQISLSWKIITHYCVCIFSIADLHGELREEEGGLYSLEPLDKNARLLLNGKACVERTPLKHNDRLESVLNLSLCLFVFLWNWYLSFHDLPFSVS